MGAGVSERYEYRVVITGSMADGYTAVLVDEPEETDSPLRGYAATPILAIAALHECLLEWPNGGSDRWLESTREGHQMQRTFTGTVRGTIKEPS